MASTIGPVRWRPSASSTPASSGPRPPPSSAMAARLRATDRSPSSSRSRLVANPVSTWAGSGCPACLAKPAAPPSNAASTAWLAVSASRRISAVNRPALSPNQAYSVSLEEPARSATAAMVVRW
jgi:hypothetical protein